MVKLSDALVQWWVLDDDHRARRREASTWASSGHAAAVLGDELYTCCPTPAAGTDAYRTSGSGSATNGSCSTSSPRSDPGAWRPTPRVRCCCSTTSPCHGRAGASSSPPRSPKELLRIQERVASTDGTPRHEAIRGRVASILPLYRLSSYRPSPPPRQVWPPGATTDCDQLPAGTPRGKPAAPTTPLTTNRERTGAATASSDELMSDRRLAEPATTRIRADSIVDLPDVGWISSRDAIHAPGDLEDQAARYHPARHELTIHADFSAIKDLTAHWRGRYQGVPGAHAVIEAHLRGWCEQVLVEVVLAARNSSWSQEHLDALLSPTSFTAALLPRHLLHAMLQKRLAKKLGAPRTGGEPMIRDGGILHRDRTWPEPSAHLPRTVNSKSRSASLASPYGTRQIAGRGLRCGSRGTRRHPTNVSPVKPRRPGLPAVTEQERTLSRFAEPGCVGELGEETSPAGRVATGFGLGEVAVADVYAGAVCFRREPDLDGAGAGRQVL
jgi:hypothetical protein